MEKLFELEDELKALTLEGVNTDKALDLLHEFIGGLSIKTLHFYASKAYRKRSDSKGNNHYIVIKIEE